MFKLIKGGAIDGGSPKIGKAFKESMARLVGLIHSDYSEEELAALVGIFEWVTQDLKDRLEEKRSGKTKISLVDSK